MAQLEVEARPLYGIGTVARLAKIKPDTLRIWERRYGLGASHKSANGRRQYSQTDLEHLQIVSTLVNGGLRIGELASMERKTLEALLQSNSVDCPLSNSERRPRALIVGAQLCRFLDTHSGCIAQLNCGLVRRALEDVDDLGVMVREPADLLIVDFKTLDSAQLARLNVLRVALLAPATLVFYDSAPAKYLSDLETAGIIAIRLPLDTNVFLDGVKLLRSRLDTARGSTNVGDLVVSQPRLLSDDLVRNWSTQSAGLDCACPEHLSVLVHKLSEFENYSKECAADNWQSAATHVCVYAYTNQARWLIEKALLAVIEEESRC